MINKHSKRRSTLVCPWRRSGEESACRGDGFDSWSGTIPQVLEQLSPQATTTETMCCNPRSRHTQSLCPHNEKPQAPQRERGPGPPQLEKAGAQLKDPVQSKHETK